MGKKIKRKNRKGFTMPEMITIILIMGMIAIIAVMIVGGILEESRRESFRDSVRNSIKSIDYYLLENNISSLPETGLKAQDLSVTHAGQFIGGKIILNDDNEYEADRVTNGRYCASGPIEDVVVAKECYMLDKTKPEFDITKVATTSTTSSIKIIVPEEAVVEEESSIKEYTYEISNSDLNYSTSFTTELNYHTFNGLKDDTTYDLKITVTNTNNLSTMKETTAKTNLIEVPTFSISPTGYATSKVVTVNYPERQVDFVYTYSIDQGNTWITVETGTSTSVTFTSNGNIIARVTDGVNYKTASTYAISGIDRVNPTCILRVTGGTLGTNNWYISNATVGFNSTLDDYSGIASSSVNPNAISGEGATTSTGTVTDQAGNVGTCTLTLYKDAIAPTVIVSGNPTSWASSAILSIIAADTTSNLHSSPYSFDGGSTWTSSNSKTFSSNQNVYIWVRDNAGNITKQTITINYVDSSLPSITGLSTSCYTPAIAATDSTSGIAGYGISTVPWSGISWAWTSAGSYGFGVKTPGTYYLYAIDNSGNIAGTSVYFDYSTLRDYVTACKGAGTYVAYNAPNGGGSSWRVLFASSSRVYIVPKGTLGTYTYSVLNDGEKYNNVASNIGYYDTQAHAAMTALDNASGNYVNTTYSDQGKSIDLQYMADHANYIAEGGSTSWSRTNVVYHNFGGMIDVNTNYWIADHHLCRDLYSSPTSACTTPFRIYHVDVNGVVDDLDSPVTRAVRPVIRLLSNVYYTGTGDGSEANPLGIVIR